MSRVDDIINGMKTSDTKKKKSRVETLIEKSSNGNLKTGVDEQYINAFLHSANDYFSNLSNDFDSIGYNNASSLYENHVSKGAELSKKANTIRVHLNSNKSNLDEETYNDLISTLDKFEERSNIALNKLRNSSQYYSKWDTEEEYNADVEAWNKYYEKWGHYADAEDFEATSASRNFVNPSDEDLSYYDAMMDTKTWRTDASGKMYDAFGNEIPYVADANGIIRHPLENDSRFAVTDPLGLFLSTTEDERETLVYGTQSGKKFETLREGVVNHWEMLKDDEVSLYYSILNKKGQDEALKYLRDTAEKLNSRWGAVRAKEIQGIDNGFIKTLSTGLLGLEAGLDQWSTGVAQIIEGESLPTSGVQYASAEMANSLEGLGKYAYNATVTVGNMLPSILTSKLLGAAGVGTKLAQGVGAVTVGASAGGNAYGQALKEGYGESQAQTYGVLVGASEAALQYLIGGIGSLGGVTDDILLAKTKMIDSSLLRVSAKFGIKLGSEVVEEELQNFLEPAFRTILFGEDYDAPTIDEIVETAIVTALSTGVLEGGSTIATDIAENSQLIGQGKDIMKAEGGIEALREIALDMVKNSPAKTSGNISKLSEKVSGEKVNARTVGKLYQATTDAATEQNKADIVKSLERKGYSAKEADYLADALVTYYTGEALTRKQLKKVESLESEGKILKTAEDVVLNEASTAGQRTANLDRFDLGIANGVGISTNASTTQKNFETKALKNEAAKVLKENNIEVSAEGKTINTKNGDITSIKNIESISESGEINLTIDDGMVVSASDLSFGSEAEALFVANIGKIKLGKKNISTASANAMYQTAMTALKSNPNMTATEAMSLIKGLEESYVFGAYNFGESNLAKSEAVAFAHELDESQRKFAYDLGSQDRASEVEKDQKVIDELKAKANSETPSKTPAKKGNVRFENGVVAKGKLQKKAVSLAKHLARAIGIDIVFYDARTTQNPNGKDANGYYDPKTDTIYLDLQNSWSDSKTIVYTMSHELVHFIKKWSPEKFNTFAKFLMKQYGEHGVDTSKLLNKKMAELGTTDSELAYEEMIADACETMLLDSNAVYKLMELRKTDLELFEKIKLYIHKILNAIRDMYKSLGLNPSSDEAKSLLEMKDVLEQIYSMFEEAAVDAAQNYQAVSTLESESVRVSEDGTVVMQMKQYQQTGRATLLKYLTEQYGTKDATDLISTIDNIYNTMKDIKKDETLSVFGNWQDSEVELDENGHPIFTTSINNGDYELNQDFSRVCKKRRQLDFVLNMLAEDPAFEASNLTKQDFVKINKAIKEHGFEIACALCFVDSKRFRQAEWADSFANTWNDILYSVVKDKSKLTPFNFATKTPNIADNGIEIDTSKSVMYRKWSEGKEDVKNRRNYNSFDEMLSKDGDKWLEGNANVRTIATLIRDNPNLRHTFRGADIIASQGFDTIQRLAPGIRSILDGWGGSSVPKPSSNDASYDSSIINMSGYNKETAYAMGGVRMNSFSDFMAHMFFDYCQAFADLAAKKLPSQAYTKELIYVRLFGRSGQKINMSGIAAIRDDALPTTERKGVSKAEAEANEKIEKMVAGLDVSRLLEHLNKDIHQLTEADVEQFLDMCDYVWADESINMKHAGLLQTGILYDKLSDSKVEECYELLKAGEIEQALEVAGKANVDTEYAKHCGTIVVGVSDAHIRKLLRDPAVRMVIPYHKSGLNPVIARELKISAYNDYTDVQNTGAYLKGSKARVKSLKADAIKGYGLKDFSFYDWFGKTIDGKVYDGKATAEKYIEWCEKGYYDEAVGDYVYYTTKKEGYILAKDLHKKLTIVPKFDAFMAEENYYKVLEDFDCYNTISGEHSEQGAVDFLRNGLPSDYKDVLVKALKDEQQVHDDFRDHLDNKGLKEEIMDIVKANGYKPSIKKQAKKIRAGMSENERYSVLKDAKIVAINDSKSEAQPLYNEIEKVPEKAKGQVEALIKDLADDLEILNVPLSTTALDIEFQLSKNNGLRESLSQQLKYGGNFHDFSKALINLRDILNRAILVEVHTEDRYKGTVREDVNFEAGYVLFSAFKSQEYVIPVKLEIKQKKDVHNILYVVVSMTKIKRISVMESALDDTEVPTIPLSDTDSVYSLPHLVSKINSKDRNFLKYLPDQMLSAEQSEAKRLALKEDKEKLNAIPKKPSSVKKQLKKDSEGNALSKEQQEYFKDSQVRWGENLMPVYHGTRRKFTVFDATEGYDENRVGGLMWAAKDYEYAKDYSYSDEPIVMKGYLNITNMLDVGDIDSYANYENRLQELADLVKLTPRELESMVDYERILIYDITSSKPFRDRIVELGYDGVVAYESGLQTFGFVDSNQFKDTTNKTPTADPDIRYQKKRNIVPIESEDLTKLEKHFGTTGNFKVAGYLLTNGKLLDFSGKHWGDTTSRTRQVDHRDAQEVLDDRGGNGFNAMIDMIGNGNIRLMPETGGINLAVYPNEKQRRVLSLYIRQMLATEGQVIIDYDDVGGDTVYSRVYEKYASPSQILADIRNYFQGGRQSELMQFHTMYQKKKDSNRSILANALEGAAQNDIERNKLAQYKEKISLIESEEQRLTEIQKQLFTKGGVEPENRKALQFEAKQIANRINTYDRQLLNLESTTALKNVLNREKQLAMKRQKQKDAEAMRNYKEKVAKTQRELLERHQESRKKAIEGRNKTALRHKIRDVVKDLDKLLNRGTKERNVKTDMQETVGSALSLANAIFKDDITNEDIVLMGAETATEKEQELLDKYVELIRLRDSSQVEEALKCINKISTLNRKLSDLFMRERARLNRAKISTAINELAKAYAKLKDSKNGYVSFAYNEEAHKRLLALSTTLEGTIVKDMTLSQLQEVYDAFKMIRHIVRESNSLFRMGKTLDLENAVKSVQSQILDHFKKDMSDPRVWHSKAANYIKRFTWNELKPVVAFERLGSETFAELFWDAIEAEGVWARDVEEAQKFLDEQIEKYNYKSWDMKETKTFKLSDGKEFKLSLQDIMSIYAYSKRPQAEEHMMVGGFQFANASTYKDGNGVERVHSKDLYVLDMATIQKIVGSLNESQKGYVEAVQGYLTQMGEKGNSVSRVLYGIDIFNETAYFPLMSATDYRSSVEEALNNTQTQASLKNMGMTKQTVPHASNPIVLQSFDDVVKGHIDKMAKYHAYALPIENLSRVFNSVTLTNNGGYISTKAVIEQVFGASAKEYFDQYITDLNGGTFTDGAKSPTLAMFSKFKGTAVGASLSVIVQQPMSITRAMTLIDPKYFVGKVAKKETKKLYDEMKKYVPVAIIKEIGGFDVGSSRTAMEYLGARTDKGFKRVIDEVNEKAMWGAAKADEFGWGIIWNAVKREVAAKQKLQPGTEEFFEACRKRCTEVIVKTQVYDSVNSRSGYMRSKSDLVKFATSFLGEPTTIVNMAYSALLKLGRAKSKTDKAEAGKYLGRTLGVLVVSTLLTTLAKSLPYAMRDDEDDEALLERWAKQIGYNMLSDLNPLSMLPFARDIVSIWEGWDVERPDMTLIANFITSAKRLIDDGATVDEVLSLIGDTANLFGIPAKNVIRDARGIINFVGDIFDDITPSGVGDAFIRGITGEKKDKGEALYNAIVNGDDARLEVYRKGYKDDKAYETAVRKALRENDPRIKEAAQARIDGDIAEYTRIVKEIKAEKNFVQDTIVAAVNAEINALSKGDSSDSSNSSKVKSMYKMDDYYAALGGGDEATAYVVKEDLIETDVANGKEREEAEDSFNGKFASYLREEYEEGNLSEYDAQRMLINYGGKTEDEAASKVQYWAFKQEYPDYEDLSEEAVNKYYSEVKPYGISVDVYYDYSKQRSKCKGVDANGDGKTDSGSVKTEVMKVINSLPISRSQKDALYYLNGWSAKTINEAPWR